MKYLILGALTIAATTGAVYLADTDPLSGVVAAFFVGGVFGVVLYKWFDDSRKHEGMYSLLAIANNDIELIQIVGTLMRLGYDVEGDSYINADGYYCQPMRLE